MLKAGAGHDHSGASEFQGGSDANSPVNVDAQTAQRLGIKTEAVKQQPLALGIKFIKLLKIENAWKYC
ncbi:hypothetical protein DSM106972_066090 [Dulcicalothrix desertica PCC 7102]|uniref:Uncharacterized protein n=1 Tax=Dulcicalothrix desertica PCC 7102 TaxID=232991 RepID=A0A433V5Y3_9CYAN|nr:hypothetical protein DSM106972_066090 [Dulcicalothrix desertica PCC 7102]